jgi:RNA-directed DNA polymerase
LRLIHAPSFRDRVLHHAVMALVGPEPERALVFDTYACRTGKGTLAAVRRCQHHARRHPVFVKIDIRAYFPSIDHGVLGALLARRFKNRQLLKLLTRLVIFHESAPGKGLPIGALTSQHFANFYLAGLDRFLLEQCGALGMVRYMDDVVWWCDSMHVAHRTLAQAEWFVRDRLLLEIKQPIQIGQSIAGMMYCGFRIMPGSIRLSRRRRQRYSARRHWWECMFAAETIDSQTLQAGYDSALAITAHANAIAWRREQLRRRPLATELLSI